MQRTISDKAIADFTSAIKLEPGFSDAYFDRAISYYGSGKFDAGLSDVEKALSLSPDDVKRDRVASGDP